MDYNCQEHELFDYYNQTNLLPMNSDGSYFVNSNGIELILRTQCNQKCEYCYIYQHGEELYPQKLTKDELVHNVDMVLDYIYCQRRNFPVEIELFGGDIVSDDLLFDVLDLLIKYFSIVYEDNKYLFKQNEVLVSMPSNLSWVYYYPDKVDKFRSYFKLLEDKFNVFLSCSWSTDGAYATSTREKKQLDDTYFDKIFEFCKEFHYGYHPMISPYNISSWCKNYDWWLEKYEQHGLTFPRYFQPYLLMVRNDDWDDVSIANYNLFMRHMMEKRLEMCHNSLDELAYHLLVGDGEGGTLESPNGSDPISIFDAHVRTEDECIACSGQTLVHFNCNNLSIVFCHRLTYPQFVPIYFIVDEQNQKIVGYRNQNVGAYITLRTSKMQNMPICSRCDYKGVCRMGCFGSQFENSFDVFMPNRTLCKFFKETYNYLIGLYNEYGIIQYAVKNNYTDNHTWMLKLAKELGFIDG